MRRLRNRELNVFSMSALDLFASALGAFILVSLILLPYYLQRAPAGAAPADRTEELSQALASAQYQALLGIHARSLRFLILVDMSASMASAEPLLRETVAALLAAMEPRHAVQIIGFQGINAAPNLFRWQGRGETASMTPENRAAALRFIDSLSGAFAGGTPTLGALRRALEQPAEAVVLITDGAPNADPEEVIRDVTARNAGRKIIHCIALGPPARERELIDFLSRLAYNNRGAFLAIGAVGVGTAPAHDAGL